LFNAHNHAFRVLGGVPLRGIYDNMRTAVDKIVAANLAFFDRAAQAPDAPARDRIKGVTKGRSGRSPDLFNNINILRELYRALVDNMSSSAWRGCVGNESNKSS
jgi:hypothetical protein